MTDRHLARLQRPELGLGLRSGFGASDRGYINLDFSGGGLPSGVTFSRSTTGLYLNASGVISAAAIDAPRFDYSSTSVGTLLGLLIEGARTNLETRSQEMANAAWSRSVINNVTDNAVTSPDGTQNAATIEWGNNNYPSLFRTVSTANGTAHLQGIFAKAGNTSVFTLEMRGASGSVYDYEFSLSGSGTATINPSAVGSPSGGILAYPNGWYYCWIIKTTTNTTPILIIGKNIGVVGQTVNLWQADLQAGASVNSSIPTVAASVTRAADVCSFVVPGGVTQLRYTFDDDSTQTVSVTPGAYTVPTNLNRRHIKRIVSL